MSEAHTAIRRYRGSRPIKALLPSVVEGCIGKRNAALARLMAHWVEIVGPEIGMRSMPVKMYVRDGAAVLTLEVQRGYAAVIQHMTPLIQERVGLFIGGMPVVGIKVSQSMVSGDAKEKPKPKTAIHRQSMQHHRAFTIAGIEDEGLRLALEVYGKCLLSQDAFNK